MTVSRLWVERYRSLVDLRIDLFPVTVIQGENATGKTNLYRVLLLLSRGAGGALARTLLEEGGMPSALWAGDEPVGHRRKRPVRMRFGAAVDDVSYELSLGLPSVDIDNPFRSMPKSRRKSPGLGPLDLGTPSYSIAPDQPRHARCERWDLDIRDHARPLRTGPRSARRTGEVSRIVRPARANATLALLSPDPDWAGRTRSFTTTRCTNAGACRRRARPRGRLGNRRGDG